ncbi:MAG: peptidylprolyl isomerase [Saprospiraceae bacterium]|nr:peptidylprolyl isomerase [Saprospiraceae bacterium]
MQKNNGNNADYSDKNLSEYLDLYTKFKLKVEKAKELKLDTIGALMSELDGYRKQLASSYLIDKEVTDFLLHELYTRTKEDVMFSHIFIPVQEGSPKAVIDEAKNKLMTVKTKISSGMSFEDAAKEYSQDKTTASKGGNMGFFTAKLPSGFYALESAISPSTRTSF